MEWAPLDQDLGDQCSEKEDETGQRSRINRTAKSAVSRAAHVSWSRNHQKADGRPPLVAKALHGFCYPDPLSLDHQATMKIIGERRCDLDETRTGIPGTG